MLKHLALFFTSFLFLLFLAPDAHVQADFSSQGVVIGQNQVIDQDYFAAG